ncbi:MAG: hypothetical protein FJX67_15735 [Alphaproteobacteria bacterium]|nr:hypothetical protein [Alphaproteobacteria bacterium]
MATALDLRKATAPRDIDTILAADLKRPEHRYLRTPLVALITAGRLPKPALKDYAILRWSFQAHATPALMLSHAAYLTGAHVHHLLENMYDEIMRPNDEGEHPGLWVRFAKGLGATPDELDDAARHPIAEVIGFPQTMIGFCRQGAAQGITTWFADEAQLPEAHGATALALRKFYGLDDPTIEYFLEHVRADIEHTGASESLIQNYIRSGLDIARARRAASVTLWAWREMHEGILRAVRKKYAF